MLPYAARPDSKRKGGSLRSWTRGALLATRDAQEERAATADNGFVQKWQKASFSTFQRLARLAPTSGSAKPLNLTRWAKSRAIQRPSPPLRLGCKFCWLLPKQASSLHPPSSIIHRHGFIMSENSVFQESRRFHEEDSRRIDQSSYSTFKSPVDVRTSRRCGASSQQRGRS